MPKAFPHGQTAQDIVPSQSPAITTPSVFGDTYTNASFPSDGKGSVRELADREFAPHSQPRSAEHHAPSGSANSWASGTRNNSFASGSAPVSALLPPQWPNHQLSKSVPSPPHTRQDYQRPDPLSAGLSQLDMTIHHHIDTAFGSLSRLISDKNDRILDQVIRRLESIEAGLSKNSKQVRSDLKGINSEVGKVKAAIGSVSMNGESTKEVMHSLEGKLAALEKIIEENECCCQQIVSNQTMDEESDRKPRSSTHRRTESAHGALGISQDCQMQQNGVSRASSKARTSNPNSRDRRSNTTNSLTNGTRVSEERGTRRGYFTDVGAARGPIPDIREHPAYAAVPQPTSHVYDRNEFPIGTAYTAGAPYGGAQFGDGGWYHQAYGSS